MISDNIIKRKLKAKGADASKEEEKVKIKGTGASERQEDVRMITTNKWNPRMTNAKSELNLDV